MWSRRGFLSARGVAASAGGLVGAMLPEDRLRDAPTAERMNYWCISRRAMACEFTVMLPPTLMDPLTAADAALDEIQRLEDLLTVYNDASLMSSVNHSAHKKPIRVQATMFEIIERARELTRQTGGAFDVATHALINAWGFFRGPRRVPSDEELAHAMAVSGMDHVELDATERTVHFTKPGVGINLGSIGKGFAIDRAIRVLREDHNIDSALIQGGRSSVYALGTPDADPRGWLVGVVDPANPEQQVATLRLRDRAMGTSGDETQFFEANGKRYGHVLDPRTGQPASELASATVLTSDAATADALATALFVMGLDKARDFCNTHRETSAVLVLRRGEASRRVVTLNLPGEDIRLL